jgi:hypothetical protein
MQLLAHYVFYKATDYFLVHIHGAVDYFDFFLMGVQRAI